MLQPLLISLACIPMLSSLVLWSKAHKSPTPRRYVMHIGLCIVVSILVAIVAYFLLVAGAFEGIANAPPSEKTRLLSLAIAGAMRVAGLCAATAIPSTVAFFLTLARKPAQG